jgi:nucleotide-binding universal stress UspA family protein
LNVVPEVAPTVFREAGHVVLDGALRTAGQLAPDLEVSGVLGIGRRSDALVHAARGAALLVLGRETRTGVERVLTGTTTAAAAAHAACDVVVVPSFWTADEAPGGVVVGVRSEHDAGDVIARAMAEAAWRRCPLTAVTAWHLADAYLDRVEARTHTDEWRTNGLADLEHLVAPLRLSYPDVEVDLDVVHGRPASVLLSASRGADLLVLTRRHFTLPPHERLGGVAHAVLRLSDVPVLVVPSNHSRAESVDLVLEAAGAPQK